MIYYFNADGSLIYQTPSVVVQGSSDTNKVYFVAPIPSTYAVSVAFRLPNGKNTARYILTLDTQTGLEGVVDENGNLFYVWERVLPAVVTKQAGQVSAQFYANRVGTQTAFMPVVFTVNSGVTEIAPPEDYTEDVLGYISNELQLFYDALESKLDKITPTGDGTFAYTVKRRTEGGQTVVENDKIEVSRPWTPNTIALRDSSGRLEMNMPTNDYDGANKLYVENRLSNYPTKTEVTTAHYTKFQSDERYYQKNAVYRKAEVNALFGATITASLSGNTLTLTLVNKDGTTLATQTVDIASTSDISALQLAVSGLLGDVSTIQGLIPAQASSSNKLADKNFVNSSISTNTAHFIGTFNSLAELEAYSGTVTNNDYANVIRTENNNTYYDRYTYNASTSEWEFNFTVNTTTFTAEQWSAINSGITASIVATIVPNTRKIAGLSLASDISASDLKTALAYTPGDIGAVPTSRTVNGKALTSDITLTASDIGLTEATASEIASLW